MFIKVEANKLYHLYVAAPTIGFSWLNSMVLSAPLMPLILPSKSASRLRNNLMGPKQHPATCKFHLTANHLDCTLVTIVGYSDASGLRNNLMDPKQPLVTGKFRLKGNHLNC
jgi:hypothetical protein